MGRARFGVPAATMKPSLANLKVMSMPVLLFVLVAPALFALTALAAENSPAARLIELARQGPGSAEFRAALLTTFSQPDLQAGKPVAGNGPGFLGGLDRAPRPAMDVGIVAVPALVGISATLPFFFQRGIITRT